MRNPMLPLSPMSNDGSLQHKPTLAPAGLNRNYRPLADLSILAMQIAATSEGRAPEAGHHLAERRCKADRVDPILAFSILQGRAPLST
jgi:hypothetical protein